MMAGAASDPKQHAAQPHAYDPALHGLCPRFTGTVSPELHGSWHGPYTIQSGISGHEWMRMRNLSM